MDEFVEFDIDLLETKYGFSKDFSKRIIEERLIFCINENDCHIRKSRLPILDFFASEPQYQFLLSDVPEYFYNVDQFEIRRYLYDYFKFHNFIDKFCWMIKLQYSEKNTIKSKQYRLDILFQEFWKENFDQFRFVSKVNNYQRITFHLKKGWYNELSRTIPFHRDFLNIGTKIDSQPLNGGSFAWNIIQSYYSSYEYINAFVYCFQSLVRTEEHKKSLNIFNGEVINRFGENLLYPFNLHSNTDFKNINHPNYLNYQYALYPRMQNKNIWNLDQNIIDSLQGLVPPGKDYKKSLIDFLYEFRVWANYTGLEDLQLIHTGPYFSFMKKNLSIICFILGSIPEIFLIKNFGEESILNELEKFETQFVSKQTEYLNKELNPIYVRFKLYKHLGIINSDLSFLDNELIKFI